MAQLSVTTLCQPDLGKRAGFEQSTAERLVRHKEREGSGSDLEIQVMVLSTQHFHRSCTAITGFFFHQTVKNNSGKK